MVSTKPYSRLPPTVDELDGLAQVAGSPRGIHKPGRHSHLHQRSPFLARIAHSTKLIEGAFEHSSRRLKLAHVDHPLRLQFCYVSLGVRISGAQLFLLPSFAEREP